MITDINKLLEDRSKVFDGTVVEWVDGFFTLHATLDKDCLTAGQPLSKGW